MDASHARRVIAIGFDFSGNVFIEPERFLQKLLANPSLTKDSLLLYVWSNERSTIFVSDRLRIETLPSFVGRFRPFYDIASVFVVPYISWRNKEKADAIQIQDFPLICAARATALVAGGEIVLRLTNLPTDLAMIRGKIHRWYHRIHEMLFSRLVDRYVVINETTRQYVRDLGVPASRIKIVVPNTIVRDAGLISSVERGRARARFGIPTNQPLVLSVARLEPEKGLDELLDLFAATDLNAKLVIIGEGMLRDALEKRTQDLGIETSVVFAGRQDRASLWECYADADVFVLLSRSEALGLVFWEAMYMRVPVIGRPVGGIVETIGTDGDRGFFWNTKDGDAAFKEKLLRCLNSGPAVKEMIERARSHVENKIRSLWR
jgi:glycosyltransferase involved in cell wall biosynthesis